MGRLCATQEVLQSNHKASAFGLMDQGPQGLHGTSWQVGRELVSVNWYIFCLDLCDVGKCAGGLSSSFKSSALRRQ
jgi:hypothetical protein